GPPSAWYRVRKFARRNKVALAWSIAVSLLLAVVGGILGGMAWAKHEEAQREKESAAVAQASRIVEARTRAGVQMPARIYQALQRLHLPTQGRRSDAQAILRKLAAPRQEIVEQKAEPLDVAARSAFVETLGVPELAVIASAELQKQQPTVWPVAIHPDGQSIVLGYGRPPRTLRWKIGEALKLPKDFESVRDRHLVTYSPDGKYLVLLPTTG